MKTPILYRKRLIPDECILLEDDIILHRDDAMIITSWNTIRPKKKLHHGLSCYLLDKGVKISKFYDADQQLICWYCDIVTYSYENKADTYIFTDLLADVKVYPDATVTVVDLDELADAFEQALLSPALICLALRNLDWLLRQIYSGGFAAFQKCIDELEHNQENA